MPTRTYHYFFSSLLAFATTFVGVDMRSAHAADSQHSSSKNPEAQAHCDKANALYMSGAYREAIAELELALAFDPSGKDLVANLATVHEKLGDIDDAIAYSQRYLEMDLSAQERSRSERTLTRLEGAKAEVLAKQAEDLEKLRHAETAYGLLPTAPTEMTTRGRFDGAAISTTVVAGAGLVTGTALGIKALLDDRSRSSASPADAAAVADQHRAHQEAIAADIGFAVFGAAAITTGILYLARTTKVERPAWTDRASLSVTPQLRGGAFKMSIAF